MEIFWNETWSGLSDYSNWTDEDAMVVCKQLHHTNGSGMIVSFFLTIILRFNFIKVIPWNLELGMKQQWFISAMCHAWDMKIILHSVFTAAMIVFSATMKP